ncbi:MAG: phosphate starvation-inducible protein [Aquabacterium sp.]|jgi:hypothetical protein|nr:MAG: phosphate starvation-inducible protein [Aquabacterium sp.]
MKHLFAVLALACAVASPTFAADAASAPSAAKSEQGKKLGACSKEAKAKGLKGEDRNKFLSSCAKGETAAADAPKSQGHKLGACSKEAKAKGLKGADRNKFLSECAKA